MIPRLLLVLAIANTTAAAAGMLIGLSDQAVRFRLTWGVEVYVLTVLPFLVLVIATIVFRKSTAATVIALISSVILGGAGVAALYGASDAMEIMVLPVLLLVGCGLSALAQWRASRRLHRPTISLPRTS